MLGPCADGTGATLGVVALFENAGFIGDDAILFLGIILSAILSRGSTISVVILFLGTILSTILFWGSILSLCWSTARGANMSHKLSSARCCSLVLSGVLSKRTAVTNACRQCIIQSLVVSVGISNV